MQSAGSKAGERKQQTERFIRIRIDQIAAPVEKLSSEAEDVWLTASIARHGLLQPLVVRHILGTDRYVLICGLRRLRACKAAGIKHVDVCVAAFDPAEAAACYLEEEMTHRPPEAFRCAPMLLASERDQVVKRFALPREKLDRRYELLSLPESVKQEIRRGKLTGDQAEPLLQIGDIYGQMEAASLTALRALSPAQVKRLVCSVGGWSQHEGRRRIPALIMDSVSRVVDAFRGKGIPLDMSVQIQEGGFTIRIVMKNRSRSVDSEGNC